MEIALIGVTVLVTGLVVRGLRRRRDGWYDHDGATARSADPAAPADARGAVNRHSWMLGGGGSGG